MSKNLDFKSDPDFKLHSRNLDCSLKSNKILSFQINSEDIGALRQAIYRLIWKTYFQYKADLQRIS